MARFTMRKLPALKGTTAGLKYPQLVVEGTRTLDDFAQAMEARSSFTAGDVKGMMAALTDYVAEQLAEGYSVKLDDFGLFSLTLEMAKGKAPEQEDGQRRNAPSVQLRSVRFRPARVLLQQAQRRCRLERYNLPQRSLLLASPEERLAKAQAFLADHALLRAVDYVALTGLSRTAANLELRQWAAQGHLAIAGRGSHRVYVKP